MIISPLLAGKFKITAAYHSPKLYAASRAIPGVQRLDGKTYVTYRDGMTLLVSYLATQGVRVDDTAFRPGVLDFPFPIAEKGLRSYQVEAVRFLIAHATEGALLGDAMRLGKSATALRAARAFAPSRTVVVCPSYVRGVWAAPGGEIEKWYGDVEVFLPTGRKPSVIPATAGIVVIHYDILADWTSAILDWGPRIFILDEIHLLANEKTQRSQAAIRIAAACEIRWGLTGTPLTNRPRDLHNVVNTLCPGRFGDFFPYGLRYCDARKEQVTPMKTVWKFDGSSNLPELHSRLATFMIRRTAYDVALELPPKTRQIVWLDVPTKCAIRETTNARALRDALDKSADAKLPQIADAVLDMLAQGQKLVCFTWRRGVADFLAGAAKEAGYQAVAVHGGVSAANRGRYIADAKTVPGSHLLACTIDTCSTGIDLSYADGAVFAELTYEPHELLQAEARILNYGSPKPTFYHYFLARGTIDEIIADAVLRKLDTIEAVVGKTGETLPLRDTEDAVDSIYRAVAEAVARLVSVGGNKETRVRRAK